MSKIIQLYIIREMLPSFFISLLVFTFISLMTTVLQITELLIVRGMRAADIFNLVALSLPFFMSLTIPMSTLLAVLLAFLRLSGDNEITVLKSAGQGLYQLMPPVVLFCLWTYMLTTFLTLTLVPAARWSFRNELLELAKTRADVAMKERVFNTYFDDMVIYINHIPLGSDLMEDLFIQDKRDDNVKSIIVADRGRIATDVLRRALIFQLFNGVIDRVHQNLDTTDTLVFRKYELRLLLDEQENKGLKSPNQAEMSGNQLWEVIQKLREKGDPDYPQYVMEAHMRYSLPMACLVLGMAAVPLGVRFRGKGRNWGVVIGLIIFLIYFLIFAAGRSLGESGRYPPVLAMWMPNIIVGLLGLLLLYRANNEKPIRFLDFLEGLLLRLYPKTKRLQ